MNMNVHFSSATNEWSTPQDLFDKLNDIHAFTLDVCATKENTKCSKYFTKEQDGLKQIWSNYTGKNTVCWMNPPYGREIKKWVDKAAFVGRNGTKVVCLLPARTDTRWWHDHVIPYGKIEFIRGRLKFSGHKHNAPFPCALVIFHTSSSHPHYLAGGE